jgi:endonuclease G
MYNPAMKDRLIRKVALRTVRGSALLFLLTIWTGCTHQAALHTRPAIGTAHAALHGGFSDQQKALAAKNCLDGMPQKTEELGPTEYVFRQGYVLEHSSVDKIPLWVCEGVDAAQLQGNLARSNKFITDPVLKGPKSTPTDYTRSGYDRGHQAPAGNQNQDQKLKDETFYMSNMAPQLPKLNRNAWKALEDKSRDWVTHFGHAYELTGPVFHDPKEDSADTADGTIQVKTIGKDAVAVPTDFYKIIVVEDGGELKAIAFVLPNKSFSPPYHLEKYIVSIKWIEQHTGLDFMPDLPAAQRQKLKNTASAMWP